MDKFRITGCNKLKGEVNISGAKNAALPIITATLLTDEPVVLHNVPDVRDVSTMCKLVGKMGTEVERIDDNSYRFRTETIESHRAEYDLVKTMRASILTLGALIGREGKASVSLPGGCAIGDRPVNLHIKAFKKLGIDIKLEHGYIEAESDNPRGTDIYFDSKTVTGTENVLMAAVTVRGETVLHNCACEPEICDLADFLRKMGANIEGDGTDTIVIKGVDRLNGTEHRIIPDRIETGTFAVAGCLTGGELKIKDCRPDHLESVLDKLEDTGVGIEIAEDSLLITDTEHLQSRDIKTLPYPGFPTDMQAQYMTLMTQAGGSAIIDETIFENRFMHVPELKRMGADIKTDGGKAVIKGKTQLKGARVMATDLRASASLVLAALIARGETVINRVYHIDRGYENIEGKLLKLGAEIERIN